MKLGEREKLFIVQRLACFDSPSEVVTALHETFGIKVDRRQVHDYDPAHRPVSEKWRAVHAEARAAFLEGTAPIGIAYKVVRLRELDRLYRRAGDRGNLVLAASLLEQAAKEVGDHYTNRRVISGSVTIEELIRDAGGGHDEEAAS